MNGTTGVTAGVGVIIGGGVGVSIGDGGAAGTTGEGVAGLGVGKLGGVVGF